MNSSYYNKKLTQLHSELEKAHERFVSASFLNIGDITNQIDAIESKIVFYNKKLALIQNAEHSESGTIFVCIVICTKDIVETTIGKERFEMMVADRYHELYPSYWKPFVDQPTIAEIIDELKKAYPISEYYISTFDSRIAGSIQNNISGAIAIIDLMSVNPGNIRFVELFDNPLANLLIPECISVKKNDRLNAYMREKRETVFSILENIDPHANPCTNYLFDISDFKNFYKKLVIFLKMRPILKQVEEEEEVRYLDFSVK